MDTIPSFTADTLWVTIPAEREGMVLFDFHAGDRKLLGIREAITDIAEAGEDLVEAVKRSAKNYAANLDHKFPADVEWVTHSRTTSETVLHAPLRRI